MPGMHSIAAKTIFLLALLPLAAGCGEATGNAQIFVTPEDTIPLGITPGTGEEDIQDGWTVTYDRFLVAIGNFRASRSDADERLSAPAVHVLDLRHAPAEGYVVATWEGVASTRWDRFGFDLPNATASATPLAPTTDADAKLLADNGWSIYFEGQIEKMGTVKKFRWGLPAGTSFEDCATSDGLTGFAVPASSSVQVKPTIHGDHWFFDNITSGAEITRRYAEYIAKADLDGDGETTIAELKQVKAADAFPIPPYQLAGALGGPILTAYDFVLAEARTLGDFQGDGECPTRAILP
jgi:hypothetical protein